MTRYRWNDIAFELIELCYEIILEIQQQLSYYKVSVYKEEVQEQVQKKLENLHTVLELIGNDSLLEIYKDYLAISKWDNRTYISEESLFYVKINNLLTKLNKQLPLVTKHLAQYKNTDNSKANTINVKKNKAKILTLCKYGSRPWSFFQNL